ncbi:MAG: isoprenyl transferase [Gammaproteobacteria bacterium]
MPAEGTASIPVSSLPRHIAIIMDGNGRWAQQRRLPRVMGHQEGVKAVRKTVDFCLKNNIEVLTLFAFSSENWRRPADEVTVLMELFVATLQRETDKLCENGVRLRFIGDRTAFSQKLQDKIAEAENKTVSNTAMILIIAANYGGKWDITQATRQIAAKIAAGEMQVADINESTMQQSLSTAGLPEPDLFIRSGGETRISNFLLWQLAYTELYFTPVLWPDFDEQALAEALLDFRRRQRRFGHISEQLAPVANPL